MQILLKTLFIIVNFVMVLLIIYRANGVSIPSELDLIPLPERTLQDRPRVARVLPPTPTTPVDDIRVDLTAGANETLSHVIRLQELEDYVETSIMSGELKRQHGLFPRGQTQSWDYGRLQANKMKNRYANLVAYDSTRVKLALKHDDPHSDYINANYIDGYKHPKAYIATQGPKPVTVNDFWRMIWQENSNLIIMLANIFENEKKKCEQYWPDYTKNVTHGEITITTVTEDIYADYTFRNITIVHNNQTRNLVHLHFTSWPDHGVPSFPQSLAMFLKKILKHRTAGPIVVHCSAGVGRTGTVILTDACLRMAAAEGQMDPLSLMQSMRSQRSNMVDNAEQYELVHILLVECLLTDSFTIPCSQFSTQLSQMLSEQRSILERQYSRLNKLCHKDYQRKNSKAELSWPEEKSRFPDIAPVNVGRVSLHNHHGGRYINAVYVDGFCNKEQFIATQLPLPNTVDALWHMVLQVKSPLIVVLNQPHPELDETTCKFWPQPDLNLKITDSLKVILKHQSETQRFELRSLQMQDEYKQQGEKKVETHDVKILTMKGWQAEEELPTSPVDLIEFWEETEREYTGHGPITVMCHDGARACGLFLASVFTVEKMKLEKEVDVGLAVRTIRQTRPHFITSLDQFEFIYQVAQTYMDTFETYANFQ